MREKGVLDFIWVTDGAILKKLSEARDGKR